MSVKHIEEDKTGTSSGLRSSPVICAKLKEPKGNLILEAKTKNK